MRDDLTEIVFILDRSGSMDSIKTDAIGGFNSFLEDQKQQPGDATFTLCQFDHEYEIVHNGKAIADVPPLNEETYLPRGMTALLDAIGRTVNVTGERLAALTEEDRPARVIVAIMTDGFENDSKEFNRAQIQEMITHQREKYSWEFIFLGATERGIEDAKSYGIRGAQVAHFMATGKGTQDAYAVMSNAVSNYRSGGTADLDTDDKPN